MQIESEGDFARWQVPLKCRDFPEQRNKMKAVVIAYTVDDGPDEADAKVAYFGWLPEGQYWSNLGLDLVLDFVVTKQVPPEVVFLIGPGRQLVPEKPGTPAPKAFKVKKRQPLISVRAEVPGVEGKVIDDLRFCDDEDIDPVATKKYWDDNPGAPTKEFLQKAVDVLVEPHIRFANGTWPASAPLPGIPPYRRNLAPSPERSVAASTPTGAQSAKDTDDGDVQEIASIASRKGAKPLGGGGRLNPWLKPVNGAKYGEICLHEGDIIDGTGKMPLLGFFSTCIDPQLDPVEYAKAISAPGDNTMQLGGKLWCVSETIHDQCAIGTLPPSDAGGLINHAPEGKGANGVWILRKCDKFPVWQCTDNVVYGAVFNGITRAKTIGVVRTGDGSFVWREIGALSPKVSPIQGNKVNASGFAFSYVVCC
eukprot:g66455.t1